MTLFNSLTVPIMYLRAKGFQFSASGNGVTEYVKGPICFAFNKNTREVTIKAIMGNVCVRVKKFQCPESVVEFRSKLKELAN